MADVLVPDRNGPGAVDPAHVDPAGRGRLVVADRAVERIAQAAASTVSGSVRTGSTDAVGGAVDAALRATALKRAYPTADCTRAGNRVRVQVEVAARWPVAAPDLAARVRHHVVDELTRLAGVVVDACDVTVATYVRNAPEVRRVR